MNCPLSSPLRLKPQVDNILASLHPLISTPHFDGDGSSLSDANEQTSEQRGETDAETPGESSDGSSASSDD